MTDNSVSRSIVFFFFQAEDGIRDVAVTGVQTCALPICADEPGGYAGRTRGATQESQWSGSRSDEADASPGSRERGAKPERGSGTFPEIGRASCRERV